MTTVISYMDSNRLSVINEDHIGVSKFICASSDFNRNHEGRWNSRVLAFVDDGSDIGSFDDGTPVEVYDTGYDDNSHVYYDYCQNNGCQIPTHGNRYCGPACELYAESHGTMEHQ